jgi:hypothetical protein
MNNLIYWMVDRPLPQFAENGLYKMDDAARYFRQYVAALLPTNPGLCDESVIAKLACDDCRVELRPI